MELVNLPMARKQNQISKDQCTKHAPIRPHICTVRGITIAKQQFWCHVLSGAGDTVQITCVEKYNIYLSRVMSVLTLEHLFTELHSEGICQLERPYIKLNNKKASTIPVL